KIAAGAHAVVLDVKVGSGAFMKDLASARQLARAMVSIGVAHGLAVTCELTDMEQPLGNAVGNSLEIAEAQGGDVSQVDDPSKLPRAPKVETLRAPRTAYVAAIAADQIGIASV